MIDKLPNANRRGRVAFVCAAISAPFALATSALLASEQPHQATPLVVSTEQAPLRTHDAGRIRILVSSASTNGRYSLLELTELPGYKTPPHMHPDMDETFYVLEGTLELRIGDQTHRLGAGSYAHIPRNTPHAQGSADEKPVRLLVTLSPGEFESFFLDRADLVTSTPRGHPDFQRLYLEIVRKHSRWLQPATLAPATTERSAQPIR